MIKIRDLKDLMFQLPFELQNIIRYKSGFITNDAKLIKDFNENLYIKKEDWVEGGSYIEHLTNICELKKVLYTVEVEEIILHLPYYLFISDSDSETDSE
tara:strand:- start:853 stop:1149 length:297 start_codon:yes stop_codon:yes gene_type:complete